ncbi:hypothetical protein CSB69_1987 [Morganella morganii]|nr:hypothetical protein CSB69_1987 [Morganella morganii]EMP51586.1 hypothetical protein C790_00981 [Morganella morganii SC01]
MIITIINPDVSKCMMNCLHGEYEEGENPQRQMSPSGVQ